MNLYTIGTSPISLKSCNMHSHDYWEIVLNTEGCGTANIGGETYAFSPGSIFCIPPHTPHGKWAENGFYDLYFHTDPTPFLKTENNRPLCLQDDAEKSMENLLRILLRTHYRKPSSADTLLFRAVMQLLSEWISEGQSDPAIERVENRLIASFADPELKVDEILRTSGYSPDYIRRKFESVTGLTPGKYLQNLRISYAKDLLGQKNQLRLSIADISLMCGFYDPRYFSRCFKAVTGVSPREYQKDS